MARSVAALVAWAVGMSERWWLNVCPLLQAASAKTMNPARRLGRIERGFTSRQLGCETELSARIVWRRDPPLGTLGPDIARRLEPGVLRTYYYRE